MGLRKLKKPTKTGNNPPNKTKQNTREANAKFETISFFTFALTAYKHILIWT